MGIVLDTTVAIDFERGREGLSSALARVGHELRGEALVISAITVAELMRGVARAADESQRKRRSDFVDEVCYAVPVISIDVKIALRAGSMSGDLEQAGFGLPFADVLIAASALELGYGVATANLRHFRRVPGLRVVEL
jgi:tRNA(fMet)-specific endonuclease VapC